MIVADTIGDSKRKYDHLSLLLDPAAIGDIFSDAIDWLLEQDDNTKATGTESAVEKDLAVTPLAEEQRVSDTSNEGVSEEFNLDLPFGYSALDDDVFVDEDEKPAELSLVG